MKLNIDSQAITLTCPACSKKISEKIGRLKNDPTLTCPGCGKPVSIDAAGLRKAMASAQKSLDDLGRSLGKLGK
jgi:endogenous inhibitor of DNA gyrase (YacG/DUF329 family)